MNFSVNGIRARLKDLERKARESETPDVFIVQYLIDGSIVLANDPLIVFKSSKDFDRYCDQYENLGGEITTVLRDSRAPYEARGSAGLNLLLNGKVYVQGQLRALNKHEKVLYESYFELFASKRTEYFKIDRASRKGYFTMNWGV